jgi:hypothetical protein
MFSHLVIFFFIVIFTHLTSLQVNEEAVKTVLDEKLSGLDVAALSLAELESDLSCTKLQAKKIFNRIEQLRQEASGGEE